MEKFFLIENRFLELSHPIFNAVFPLTLKPQVPSEDSAERNKGRESMKREDEIHMRDRLCRLPCLSG